MNSNSPSSADYNSFAMSEDIVDDYFTGYKGKPTRLAFQTYYLHLSKYILDDRQ